LKLWAPLRGKTGRETSSMRGNQSRSRPGEGERTRFLKFSRFEFFVSRTRLALGGRRLPGLARRAFALDAGLRIGKLGWSGHSPLDSSDNRPIGCAGDGRATRTGFSLHRRSINRRSRGRRNLLRQRRRNYGMSKADTRAVADFGCNVSADRWRYPVE